MQRRSELVFRFHLLPRVDANEREREGEGDVEARIYSHALKYTYTVDERTVRIFSLSGTRMEGEAGRWRVSEQGGENTR